MGDKVAILPEWVETWNDLENCIRQLKRQFIRQEYDKAFPRDTFPNEALDRLDYIKDKLK